MSCRDCDEHADEHCVNQCCKACCERTEAADVVCAIHDNLIGQTFTGLVDGVCDGGYFVTTMVGNTAFKGILFKTQCAVKVYKVPKDPMNAAAGDAASADKGGVVGARAADIRSEAETSNDEYDEHRKRRRNVITVGVSADAAACQSTKKRKRKADKSKPKRNVSSYLHFLKTQRAEKAFQNMSFSAISQDLAKTWRSMSEAEKMPYHNMARADKLRYETERDAWEKAQRASSAQQDTAGS